VGTKGEELVVDGVSRAEGDRLRARLLARRAVGTGHVPEDVVPNGEVAAPAGVGADEVVTRFDVRWLLYSPLVASYLAVPLAAFGALLRLLDEVPDQFRPQLSRPGVPDGLLAALLLAGGLVLLVLGSIAGSAVVNWRFRLVRRGGSLIATRGLVTRRHTELEIDRIRGCTVTQGVGMRVARAARASALVTGLGDAARRGQLLPLGPEAAAWALADRLVEPTGPLRRHPSAARRRSIVRSVAPGALVLVAGAVLTALAGWWPLLLAGAVLAGLGALRRDRARHRTVVVRSAVGLAGARARGAAAPGGGGLAGAPVAVPAPLRPGHRAGLRRRGEWGLRRAGHGRRRGRRLRPCRLRRLGRHAGPRRLSATGSTRAHRRRRPAGPAPADRGRP
jgi:hypothetical protein